MNNYEYIIASLPVLQQDNFAVDCEAVIGEIKGQLNRQDNEVMDFLLDGWNEETLDRNFYEKASAHRCGFIREFFKFDLNLRNAKVEYLNKALGRPEGTDMIVLDESEAEEEDELASLFQAKDLLERERRIDDAVWSKVDEMTVMEVFSLEVILAFTVKLKIIGRWLQLDADTGRELLRKFVFEIKNTTQI